ncbi:MAG: hypothetical protein L0H93_17425 [Nocardioides sp.]|nr:hypothetical protein [Nocardioides sp.]
MDTDRDWQRLVTALDGWASAAVVAPGQIEVTMTANRQPRRVVIVMTPSEWEDMSGTMWGDFDNALDDVLSTLTELKANEQFAVYSDYRLEPSTEPTLPDVENDAQPESGGEWVACGQDGRRRSRFEGWTEPDSLD